MRAELYGAQEGCLRGWEGSLMMLARVVRESGVMWNSCSFRVHPSGRPDFYDCEICGAEGQGEGGQAGTQRDHE